MTDQWIQPNFVRGEKQDPVQYTFRNADGSAKNITGYNARITVKERDSAAQIFNAAVTNGPGGVASYSWTGAEFPTAGRYTIWIWVGNGTNLYASDRVRVDVQEPDLIPTGI